MTNKTFLSKLPRLRYTGDPIDLQGPESITGVTNFVPVLEKKSWHYLKNPLISGLCIVFILSNLWTLKLHCGWVRGRGPPSPAAPSAWQSQSGTLEASRPSDQGQSQVDDEALLPVSQSDH